MVIRYIGEQLASEGLISTRHIDEALEIQRNTGGRIGDILTAAGRISPLIFYHSLALLKQQPFVNLIIEPPDHALLDSSHLTDYLTMQAVPWRRHNGKLVIACTDVTKSLKSWAEHLFNEPVIFAVTSPRDILHALTGAFGNVITEQARTRLLLTTPHLSAFHTASREQIVALLLLLILLPAAIFMAPHLAIPGLILLLNIFYMGTVGLKYILYLASRQPMPLHPKIFEQDLPIYTVLVPLYKESRSVPHLLSALRTLDYPKHKLDIKLIVEADDRATVEAIKHHRPEAYFEIISVPYSQPRTKPKACNYALTFARGEFVTIYDAEDRPEPEQLKKAVMAFRQLPGHIVCLQARLNYYNRSECLLSQLFSIEYSALFDILLPGLQRLKIPIPLGGTSNHFRLAALREVGEWDPYNVTEDADLGMRLAIYGYEARMLDSITMEESPITLNAWMKQRSRWIKGYMQTWLVYMRKPLPFFRRVGNAGFWGFQFFVGSPSIVFLLAPLLWAFTLSWWFDILPAPWLPGWLAILCHILLISGIFIHLWMARLVVLRGEWTGMTKAIAFYPFYWLLHSLASYRALWQLIRRPHYWEKTAHGLSKYTS